MQRETKVEMRRTERNLTDKIKIFWMENWNFSNNFYFPVKYGEIETMLKATFVLFPKVSVIITRSLFSSEIFCFHFHGKNKMFCNLHEKRIDKSY